MSAALRIVIVAAILTLALVYMIWDRVSLLANGRVITLAVEPVDPTDLFRGDYVILTYKISQLDLGKLDGDDEFVRFQTVFVTLSQGPNGWSAVAAHRDRPKVDAAQMVLRGTVREAYRGSEKEPSQLTVHYGIESYFVPQGAGKPIEDQRNKEKVSVDIAVDRDGRAAIKALKIDGAVYAEEGLF